MWDALNWLVVVLLSLVVLWLVCYSGVCLVIILLIGFAKVGVCLRVFVLRGWLGVLVFVKIGLPCGDCFIWVISGLCGCPVVFTLFAGF